MGKIGKSINNFLIWLETKIFAFLSIAFACAMIYYSNFFKVLYEHDKIDNFYFYISILCYTISISVILFLSFYLPYFRNINEDQWELLYPNLIPTATLTGVIGMISLIISVWNVWGWLSIIIVISFKLGFVMTAHFTPGGTIGSIVFFLILIGALFSHFYIEHNGYLH